MPPDLPALSCNERGFCYTAGSDCILVLPPEVAHLAKRKTIDGIQSLVICVEYARIWFKDLYEDTSDLEMQI